MIKKIFAIITLCFVLFQCLAYAQKAEYDNDTSTVLISGKLDATINTNKILPRVLITILKPGITLEQYKAAPKENILNMVENILQTTSDKNGNYLKSSPIYGEMGEYTVLVTDDLDMSERITTFYHAPTAIISSVIQAIASQTTKKGVESILKSGENEKALGLTSMNYYVNISNKDFIYERLSEETVFSDIPTFKQKVIEFSIIQALNEALSLDDVKAIFQYAKDNSIINIENNISATTFNNMSATLKDEVYKEFLETSNFIKKDEVINYFELQTISKAFLFADGYLQIGDIITRNASLIKSNGVSIDLSLYSTNITIKNYVDKKFVGKTFYSFSEMKAFFDTSIEKAKDSIINKIPTQKSSGGGGTSVVVPIAIAPQPTPDIDQNKGKFNDISSVLWAKDAIDYLVEKNIISGKQDDKFVPNDDVLREEFVKMVCIAFDIVDDKEARYEDVKQSDWYYKYVCSAANNKIVSGISETMFGSGMKITRQDIATILYNVLMKKNISLNDGTMSFDDNIEISDYAKRAVNVLGLNGIINGKGNNKFEPKEKATRAEAAQLIYKLKLAIELK